MTDLQSFYNEGRDAADNRVSFSECPYLFCKLNISESEFNGLPRKRMDAWFKGWKDRLDECGLRSDFGPAKDTKHD